MKLTQKQLRSIVESVVSEAPKKRKTGSRKPAPEKQFQAKLADHIAGHIDDMLDRLVREAIGGSDVNEVAAAAINDVRDEVRARPETAQKIAQLSPTELEFAVLEAYKKLYDFEDVLGDIVNQVVGDVLAEFEEMAVASAHTGEGGLTYSDADDMSPRAVRARSRKREAELQSRARQNKPY